MKAAITASFCGKSATMGAASTGVGSTSRGLTAHLITARRGYVNRTRKPLPNSQAVGQNTHPDLLEATVVTRFWRNVAIGSHNDCWDWQGDTRDGGYGVFYYHGRVRGSHELALSFSTGEMRHSSLDTCHSCDNRSCCNPSHLRFDTRKSNVADMLDRGRAVVGSKSSNTKLTEAEVLTIRERRALGARMSDLAFDFDVNVSAISAIVHGRNWKHVGGPITNRHISRTRKEAA